MFCLLHRDQQAAEDCVSRCRDHTQLSLPSAYRPVPLFQTGRV